MCFDLGSSNASLYPFTLAFYLLIDGSMCSIAAVSGTHQDSKLYLCLDLHYAQSAAARILSLVLAFSIVGVC
jgi:hypothetical protein